MARDLFDLPTFRALGALNRPDFPATMDTSQNRGVHAHSEAL